MQTEKFTYWKQNIGWLLALLFPIGVLYFSQNSILSLYSREFLAIVSLAICMWIFDLTPIFVPALLVLVMTILLDIAPKEIVLAGFTSDTFFMCLGIFILAAQILLSGLMYRLTLLLLRWLPPSSLFSNLILFVSGTLLTMVIPSPLGRSALLTPLIFELIEKKPNAQKKVSDVTPLLISGLHGTTLLSTIFLTGNPLNFVMLGFFDTQTQYRFQWLNWFQTTAIVGLILTLGYLAIIYWQARKSDWQPLSKSEINELLTKMGPMSIKEWGGVIATVSLSVGILTSSYHHVELVWLAFGTAVILYLYGSLSVKDLRTHIDWPILLFIASIASWGAIMDYLKLNKQITEFIATVELWKYLQTNLLLGMGVLAVGIILIRLLFPGGPTFVILMSAIIPLVSNTGISPWVVGFIILTISEGFILPYQHGVYTQLIGELETRGLTAAYSTKDLLISNTFLLILRLVALYATLLYWQQIAII